MQDFFRQPETTNGRIRYTNICKPDFLVRSTWRHDLQIRKWKKATLKATLQAYNSMTCNPNVPNVMYAAYVSFIGRGDFEQSSDERSTSSNSEIGLLLLFDLVGERHLWSATSLSDSQVTTLFNELNNFRLRLRPNRGKSALSDQTGAVTGQRPSEPTLSLSDFFGCLLRPNILPSQLSDAADSGSFVGGAAKSCCSRRLRFSLSFSLSLVLNSGSENTWDSSTETSDRQLSELGSRSALSSSFLLIELGSRSALSSSFFFTDFLCLLFGGGLVGFRNRSASGCSLADPTAALASPRKTPSVES